MYLHRIACILLMLCITASATIAPVMANINVHGCVEYIVPDPYGGCDTQVNTWPDGTQWFGRYDPWGRYDALPCPDHIDSLYPWDIKNITRNPEWSSKLYTVPFSPEPKTNRGDHDLYERRIQIHKKIVAEIANGTRVFGSAKYPWIRHPPVAYALPAGIPLDAPARVVYQYHDDITGSWIKLDGVSGMWHWYVRGDRLVSELVPAIHVPAVSP